MTALTGIFVILHGLVHMWYVVLSFEWVAFQPGMGWSSKSWLFSSFSPQPAIRSAAGILFILATISFLMSGIGIFIGADWMRTLILASSIFSSLLLISFWDGNFNMIVQKGLLGLLINLIIIAVVLLRR
jgi:hypothetical protein